MVEVSQCDDCPETPTEAKGLTDAIARVAKAAMKGHRHQGQEKRLARVEAALDKLEVGRDIVARVERLEQGLRAVEGRLKAAEASGGDRVRSVEARMTAFEQDVRKRGSGQTFNTMFGKLEDLEARLTAVEGSGEGADASD